MSRHDYPPNVEGQRPNNPSGPGKFLCRAGWQHDLLLGFAHLGRMAFPESGLWLRRPLVGHHICDGHHLDRGANGAADGRPTWRWPAYTRCGRAEDSCDPDGRLGIAGPCRLAWFLLGGADDSVAAVLLVGGRSRLHSFSLAAIHHVGLTGARHIAICVSAFGSGAHGLANRSCTIRTERRTAHLHRRLGHGPGLVAAVVGEPKNSDKNGLGAGSGSSGSSHTRGSIQPP